MGWPTVQEVVAQAGVELGLLSAGDLGNDAYDSSNPIVLQLLALLKKTGRDLVDEYEWQQLRAEWSITTTPAQTIGAYTLPADWRSMINQSGWNRTTRLPMGGALSEQEWQYLASRLTGVVWTVLFRPMQGLLWLYPPTGTPTGQAITFAYKSAYWVRPATLVEGVDYAAWQGEIYYLRPGVIVSAAPFAQEPYVRHLYRLAVPGFSNAGGPDHQLTTSLIPTISGTVLDGTCQWNWIGTVVDSTNAAGTADSSTPSFATKDVPTAGSDVLLFDEQLLVARLKLAWKKEKGFDTTDLAKEAVRQFDNATSNNESPSILSLNGRGITQDRLLSGLNVPITGFGS